MFVWVTFQSPTGQQRFVCTPERSSDERTIAEAQRTAQRSWEDKCEGWLPVGVTEWNPAA